MIQTFDAESAYKELSKHFHERVRRDELLARHCTFGVGGPADVWVTIDSRDDLISLVRLSIERRWPLLLVGNGTNVLYADAGVRGIVARIAVSGQHFTIGLQRADEKDRGTGRGEHSEDVSFRVDSISPIPRRGDHEKV